MPSSLFFSDFNKSVGLPCLLWDVVFDAILDVLDTYIQRCIKGGNYK